MTLVQALAPAADLAIPAGRVWLYTGAEGPPLTAQVAALQQYQANRALGEEGRAAHAAVEHKVRTALAKMLGLTIGDIALVSNASEAFNLLSGSLGLQPGDNVVVNDLEYPSVVQPWLRLAEQGVEVRLARHRGAELPAATIAALVDARTKVIAVSHVSYQSGLRHDLAALSAIADQVGALFAVDATQSLGVVPVPAELADVVISSSYKWLLGGHGIGMLAWNRKRRELPEPPAVGWRSVPDIFTDDRFERYHLHTDTRRFEVGFPSYPTLYLLDASLTWLSQFDPHQVEAHVLALGDQVVEEFTSRGWQLLTPTDRNGRAGNIAVDAADGARLAEGLVKQNVHCWGGDGRLRVSTHLFNSGDDVARLFEALDAIPR